jgi:hypothetical protein
MLDQSENSGESIPAEATSINRGGNRWTNATARIGRLGHLWENGDVLMVSHRLPSDVNLGCP